MPRLLFRLNQVPEEELAAVKALLDEQGIEYYQTPAGRWGISSPGIWLPDGVDYAQAKALLDAHQAEWTREAREAYAEARRRGELGFWRHLLRNPVRSLAFAALALLILYLSIAPFIWL